MEQVPIGYQQYLKKKYIHDILSIKKSFLAKPHNLGSSFEKYKISSITWILKNGQKNYRQILVNSQLEKCLINLFINIYFNL